MLKLSRSSGFICVPAGVSKDKTLDYWLHLEFCFNPKTTDIDVASWAVTNAMGEDIKLNNLEFSTLEFVVNAVSEEHEYAKKHQYDELSNEYYATINCDTADRLEET